MQANRLVHLYGPFEEVRLDILATLRSTDLSISELVAALEFGAQIGSDEIVRAAFAAARTIAPSTVAEYKKFFRPYSLPFNRKVTRVLEIVGA